jgi:hypothetical protein
MNTRIMNSLSPTDKGIDWSLSGGFITRHVKKVLLMKC